MNRKKLLENFTDYTKEVIDQQNGQNNENLPLVAHELVIIHILR